jgi:hypothetical protein
MEIEYSDLLPEHKALVDVITHLRIRTVVVEPGQITVFYKNSTADSIVIKVDRAR